MDKYAVKLLSRAYQDLDGIYAYIAESLLEPGTAQKLLDVLEEAIFSLGELPQRGAPRKNGAYTNKGYRQLFIKNFTVVYRVDEAKKQVSAEPDQLSGNCIYSLGFSNLSHSILDQNRRPAEPGHSSFHNNGNYQWPY